MLLPNITKAVGAVVPKPQQPTAVASTVPMVPQSTPVPKPQYTDSQKSAQDWINNSASGQGGMQNYTYTQNQRWAEANKAGDTDLINRLQADSQRVGYDLTPIPKAPTISAPTGYSAPTNTAAPNSINTSSLQSEAAAQIAKQRAALQQAVNSTITGLNNSYSYQKQLTNDSRVLENNAFKRNTNPFSGKTDYLAADLARTRSIEDTQYNKDFQAKVSEAQQKLADFDTLAPEQQNALYQQLLRIERDYGLNVGQLTGTFNGQRTLAGSAQDANFTGVYNGQQTLQAQNQAFQQQLALADLMGQFNGQSTLAGKQANLNAALQVGQQTGTIVQPKSDWGQLFTQNGAPNYQAQQDAIQNQQWQKTFEENVRQFGLEYALNQMQVNNSAANAANDNTRQQEALQLQRDRFAWEKEQANSGTSGSTRTDDINQFNGTVVGNLDKMTPDLRKQFFQNEKQTLINKLGVSGYNTLYNMYFDQYGEPKQ